MNLKPNKKTETFALISGLVFVLSGLAKSLNISGFAASIHQYGLGDLSFLAPIIVLSEVLFGLLLVFNIRTKQTAILSAIMVLTFSGIFAYGVVFRQIEDCGCFGSFSFLNTRPGFTFIRNAVLLYLLVGVAKNGTNRGTTNAYIIGTMTFVMCMASFTSGFTFQKTSTQKSYTPKPIGESILGDFVATSADSTYLVFAFTYSCHHCLNSIENLKGYESSGAVNKVIALTLHDSAAEQHFFKNFNPAFSIRKYDARQLFRLTNTFPRAYYVRNDSIIAEISGTLPCSYVFMRIKG